MSASHRLLLLGVKGNSKSYPRNSRSFHFLLSSSSSCSPIALPSSLGFSSITVSHSTMPHNHRVRSFIFFHPSTCDCRIASQSLNPLVVNFFDLHFFGARIVLIGVTLIISFINFHSFSHVTTLLISDEPPLPPSFFDFASCCC